MQWDELLPMLKNASSAQVAGTAGPCWLCLEQVSRFAGVMQDMHNELQDVMGQSFGVPDDIDEVLTHLTDEHEQKACEIT